MRGSGSALEAAGAVPAIVAALEVRVAGCSISIRGRTNCAADTRAPRPRAASPIGTVRA
jgi:hypothetical protein